jgi:homogentisate 1,2-dioxygenase
VTTFRRGEIPRRPHGVDDHPDEIYTLQGFFGDWVHVFRERGNLGVPKAWSSDDLMYAGIDTAHLGAVPVLEGDGFRVLISHGTERYERNVDYNQIRFYHRGSFDIDTELGRMEATAGDFVVVGKGLIYRERPRTDDAFVLIFEIADPIVCAEHMWDSVGFASMYVDYSDLTMPVPDEVEPSGDTDVHVWSDGAWHTITYDFDPCADVVGWIGDPVIYRLNVQDVPGIGTARGFLPPPAHAVLMSENKSFFFNVLGVPPSPTYPAPEGSFGAPAHLNDYDEVWFNHASEFLPQNLGHLWLFPRTIPHPGFKRPPQHPPNPPRAYNEIKINFDTRAKLRWTPEAKAAFLDGDVRRNVFLSLYGMPPEFVDTRIPE